MQARQPKLRATRSPRAFVLPLLVVGCCTSSPALAQPSSQPSPGREHFLRGEVFYRTGRFREAIVAYQHALKEHIHPAYLYNIAQCHRQLGNLREAIFSYRLFLADWRRRFPAIPPPWRAEVEEHLRSLTAELDRRSAEGRCVQRLQALQTRCGAERAPAPDPAPRWGRTAAWTALGVGGAALVTGIVFGGLARGRADEYNAGAREGRSYGELEELRGELGRFEQVHLATLVSGAVLAVGAGSYLLWDWIGRRSRLRSPRIVLLPSGAGVNALARF